MTPPVANQLQHAVRERDLTSEHLLRTGGSGIEPLPPTQFHVHQNAAPYLPSLPALQRNSITDQNRIAHDHWLATTVHSLAVATIYGHAFAPPSQRDWPHLHASRATPSPMEPDENFEERGRARLPFERRER